MSRYVEKIDDIFQALYGESVDEDGEKYSEIYRYEIKGMERDFYSYVEFMDGMPFNVMAEDLAKFIIWTEFESIGYTRYNKKIDFVKLTEIVKELMTK